MKANLPSVASEVMDIQHLCPAVSIIMPFNPKMTHKNEINRLLKIAVSKVQQELEANYNNDMGALVMQKLKAIIQNLNFSTHRKSVAIYVSPVFETVLYVEMEVEMKIVIDESFEIRDLVYCKKELHEYLVLLLSTKESKLFFSSAGSFTSIVINKTQLQVHQNYTSEHSIDSPVKPLMDKFLLQVDNGLGIILDAYRLPLFVLGEKEMLEHFESITMHRESIIAVVPGNYEEATVEALNQIIAPYIQDWEKLKYANLLNQMAHAKRAGKLATGMHAVWREATHKNGRMLLVEKNHMHAAQHGVSDDIIYKASESYNKFSHIRDAVDDIIEKVLSNGGDVEFVDGAMPDEYEHIALIQFH